MPDGPGHDGAAADGAATLQGLLAAVQDWAQRAVPNPPSGQVAPECQWCPLCQLASVLRAEYPALADRWSEAGEAVGVAVRALLESAARATPGTARPGSATPGTDEPSGPAPRTAQPKRAAPRPRVEHIRLVDTTPDPADRS